MATVYDKSGKEYNVPHAVDVREWVNAGYLEEKPKRATSTATTPPPPKKVSDVLIEEE
jgi:hypothetical protein